MSYKLLRSSIFHLQFLALNSEFPYDWNSSHVRERILKYHICYRSRLFMYTDVSRDQHLMWVYGLSHD